MGQLAPHPFLVGSNYGTTFEICYPLQLSIHHPGFLRSRFSSLHGEQGWRLSIDVSFGIPTQVDTKTLQNRDIVSLFLSVLSFRFKLNDPKIATRAKAYLPVLRHGPSVHYLESLSTCDLENNRV